MTGVRIITLKFKEGKKKRRSETIKIEHFITFQLILAESVTSLPGNVMVAMTTLLAHSNRFYFPVKSTQYPPPVPPPFLPQICMRIRLKKELPPPFFELFTTLNLMLFFFFVFSLGKFHVFFFVLFKLFSSNRYC